jgi:hypothetical protein
MGLVAKVVAIWFILDLFNLKQSTTSIPGIYLSITKEEVENLNDIQDLFVY